METREIILELRTQKGLSQEELAEKVMVTDRLGKWRNDSKYRDIKIIIKGI